MKDILGAAMIWATATIVAVAMVFIFRYFGLVSS